MIAREARKPPGNTVFGDIAGEPSMPSPVQWIVAVAAFLGGMAAVGLGMAWPSASLPPIAEVSGFTGNAGEWELTATLTRDGDTRELAGPMKMTHVGWCSQDGPQEKAGELRVRMHRLFPRIDATVSFDGVACNYQGSLSDAYEGKMTCPDRRPIPLLMWIR